MSKLVIPRRSLILGAPAILLARQAQALTPAQRAVLFSRKPDPTVLLLDQVTGAAAAYSLRKLRAAYASMAVSIRRSSDNAQQDIGFTASGDFNAASFSAFIGGGSEFITKWYDQSGNANDLSQATAAKQPSLSLSAIGGRAAAVLSGSAFVSRSGFSLAAPQTICGVGKRTSGTTFSDITAAGASPDFELGFKAANNAWTDLNGTQTSMAATDNSPHAIVAVANGASSSMTVDGTTQSVSITSASISSEVLVIGAADASSDDSLTGDVTEVLWFGVALGAGQVSTVVSNQRAYYGF